ncbi:SPW repeat protein [Chelativorans salis]|uniref:SPW repeat protein n=1 Tax=Chelativorans salis TaxID=2978478 RepID=A0ABT2LJT2_9HYPH|nr:SPW repeat protein [Chelativorans sp. EGI FJ00035]MCT7374820.1 SPW repeat protein [Chelativorans sp. EGI FJ00035]
MAKDVIRNTQETALDVVNLVVGIALLLTPWALGFMAETTAAWNAWVVGALIALVAIGALVSFAEWEEWVNLVLGIWAIISPWVLGFAAIAAALWAHVIAGLIVAVLAGLELYFARQRMSAA